MTRPRVVVLRGHSANPWELGVWELLLDRFDVSVVVTSRNPFDLTGLELEQRAARTRRGLLPKGRVGDLGTHVVGDRYLGLDRLLRGADIVHSAELGTWFSAQAADLRQRLGFRLVLTVWETIPYLDAFLDPVRAPRFRSARTRTVPGADLFLAATERARACLLLEGAEDERIVVSPPGIDVGRFSSAVALPPAQHLVVSPGRLVWEKGHQDVMRALAATGGDHRLLIVGSGRERPRLLAYAARLGIATRVDIRSVPYGEMPELFARASVVALASLTLPHWEEQFGMVLAEAMAAGAPVIASRSGAIPEVVAGSQAQLFDAGDWVGLARLLEEGPLAGSIGARVRHDPAVLARYDRRAAAERLAEAYDRVLARP